MKLFPSGVFSQACVIVSAKHYFTHWHYGRGLKLRSEMLMPVLEKLLKKLSHRYNYWLANSWKIIWKTLLYELPLYTTIQSIYSLCCCCYVVNYLGVVTFICFLNYLHTS